MKKRKRTKWEKKIIGRSVQENFSSVYRLKVQSVFFFVYKMAFTTEYYHDND